MHLPHFSIFQDTCSLTALVDPQLNCSSECLLLQQLSHMYHILSQFTPHSLMLLKVACFIAGYDVVTWSLGRYFSHLSFIITHWLFHFSLTLCMIVGVQVYMPLLSPLFPRFPSPPLPFHFSSLPLSSLLSSPPPSHPTPIPFPNLGCQFDILYIEEQANQRPDHQWPWTARRRISTAQREGIAWITVAQSTTFIC